MGPVYAKKLVRAFGEKVFDIIETTPDRLREVDGIGPVRAASILAAWAEQKAVREIMVFLHSHGVSTARALLEVPQELIQTALELELRDGTVIADRVGETPCVFLAGLYRAERTIAERLRRLANGTLPWPWIDQPCRGLRSGSILLLPKARSPQSALP